MSSYTKFVVFMVLLVVGHVQSRVTSGISVMLSPTGHEVNPPCPHNTTSNTTLNLSSLLRNQTGCTKPNETFHRLMFLSAITDKYLLRACALVPKVRACMDDLDVKAAACLNNMEANMFKATRENADITFSASCGDDGDTVVHALDDELNALSSPSMMKVIACVYRVLEMTQFDVGVDVPVYTMSKYRGAKEARGCILNAAREDRVKMRNFEQFCDKVIGSKKCISPATEGIVLCRSLELT